MWLGELRMDDDRSPPRAQSCDQGERLRRPGGGQHLVESAAVSLREGLARRIRVRIRRQHAQALAQSPVEPAGASPAYTLTAKSWSRREPRRRRGVAGRARRSRPAPRAWASLRRAPAPTGLPAWGDASWTRSAKRRARVGWPAQWTWRYDACSVSVTKPVRLAVHGPRGAYAVSGRRLRPVELVPGDPLARSGEPGVRGSGRHRVAQGQPRRHACPPGDRAGHPVAVQALGEIEQPGALRHRRDAGRHGVAQVVEERTVAGECVGVHLGEAAAEVEAARGARKRRVGQRVEGDHLAAGRGQQLLGLGVPEGECASAGHRDDRAARAEPSDGPSTSRSAAQAGPGRGGAARATSSSAPRSRPCATCSPRWSTIRAESARSATGTRPRCRDGAARRSSGGSTPRTGTRERAHDLVDVAPGAGPVEDRPRPPGPSGRTTPGRPRAHRTVRDIRETSTTSTTGVPVSRATWAVEAKPSVPSRPS